MTLSLPHRHFKLRTEGLERPVQRYGLADLVVSRGLCRFQRFDLGQLPENRRRSALALQLQRWAPFPQPRYAVAWKDGIALVWVWDEPAIGESAKSLPSRQLPEVLLHPILEEGIRLVACLDGVEAQCWRRGSLYQSHWWPALPLPSQWLQFQRDCQITSEALQPLPPAQTLTWLPQPWTAFSGLRSTDEGVTPWELWAYVAAVVMLGAPTSFMAVRHLQIQQAIDTEHSKLDAERERSLPVLKARDDAVAALDRLQAIQGRELRPPQLQVMAAMAPTIADAGAFLKEWDLSDGKLRILLGTSRPAIAGADFVNAFDRLGLFDDIKVISGSDAKTIGFTMRILPVPHTASEGRAEGKS